MRDLESKLWDDEVTDGPEWEKFEQLEKKLGSLTPLNSQDMMWVSPDDCEEHDETSDTAHVAS